MMMGSAFVYFLHSQHLPVAFCDIFLIDTQRINPEENSGPTLQAGMPQERC
jgi:hypothetical protein